MRSLRIGTRRSRLAMIQAEEARALLRRQGCDVELVPMTTGGDEGAEPESSPQGLKGLWIDTILEALRTGDIDLAVHSAKDLPAEEEDELMIGAVPKRADPRDVLILREPGTLAAGMVVGTSSVRRRAQIQASVPGVGVADLRGNVETRLRKLADGDVDAAILAAAGLARLELDPANARTLGLGEMLPAPGQGALAMQCRTEDRELRAVLSVIDHRPSGSAVAAERELMRRLGGGCAVPLGAVAAMRGDDLRLAACVASPDGVEVIRAAAEASDPVKVADQVHRRLAASGAERILAEAQRA
jgi:hydroxymethylbilane synthase